MAAPHLHAPSILRDAEQEEIGRKNRRRGKREKGRARAADVPHYGYGDPKKGWQGPVERIVNPIQRSTVLLTWCATCREWMLEGSYAARHCVTCGAPHPLPAGLPG